MALFRRKIAPALTFLLLFLLVFHAVRPPLTHAATPPPIIISGFTVVANRMWNDTTLDVTAGSTLSLKYISGGISPTFFGVPNIDPAGKAGCVAGGTFVVSGVPCYSLIGRIGNGAPFSIPMSWQFPGFGFAELIGDVTIPTSGRLSLGVNDEVLHFSDNTGAWRFDLVYRPIPTPKTPLLLIPGIGGSELKVAEETFWSKPNGHGGVFTNNYPNGEKIWVNEGEAAKPGDDDYFDVLRMNLDGVTSVANIELTGNLYAGAYSSAITFFTSNGYALNQDFFIFSFDWRKDNALAAGLLDQKIEQIKSQTNSQKVDIVAHSMGGLVARYYISDPIRAQNVRKLFTLGTPHLGSVKFLKALRYGVCLKYELGALCFTLAPSEVRDVLQNAISGFQLAPSQFYFNFYTGEDNQHPFPYRTESGTLNYDQIKSLLTILGHNTLLFNPSETFHSIDSTLTNVNGVEVTNIVGSGQNTIGQIIEQKTVSLSGTENTLKDVLLINGDETVPLLSASLDYPSKGLSLLGPASLYYTSQKHENLVADGPALNLVKNILEGSSQIPPGVSTTPYNLSGTSLSIHSPVNMHVYDANGNHTGPTPDGNFEETISGSSYDTLGDAKFIYLPDDGIYTVKFEAIDKGSFDFKIKKFENDENTETILYKEVPLTNNTRAETTFDTNSDQVPLIKVDKDGDGIVDSNVSHFSILEGTANYDYTPPNISFDVNPKIIWPPTNKMVDIAITGTVADENPYLTTILVDDEYDLIEPSITTYYQTEVNQTIQLEASRRGDDKDGRTYTIRILVTDLAGNTSLSSFVVIVPHDQRDER